MPSAQDLIRELLDESVRARRRRLWLSSTRDCTLYALKPVDATLDRNIQALASFGPEALQACNQKIKASAGSRADEDAAVHLLCAVAVQLPDGDQRNRDLQAFMAQYLANHAIAIRDALWFYPVGLNEFDIRHHHVVALLADANPAIQRLAIDILGRRGARTLAPLLRQRHLAIGTGEHALRPTYELALARLGFGLPTAIDRIPRIHQLLAGSPQDRKHALALIAASGQTGALTSEQYLEMARTSDAEQQRLALCLATLVDPLVCAQAISRETTIDPALRTRIMALAGWIPGLIRNIQSLTAQTGPSSAENDDMLLTVLGHVPAAAKTTVIDTVAREQQLRDAVLRCLRQCHVNVHNDADTCPWETQRLLAPEALEQPVRVRHGNRFGAGGSIPTEIASRMSSDMRQLLYWEQAGAAQAPYGFDLSPYANARLQYTVLQASEWLTQHLELAA